MTDTSATLIDNIYLNTFDKELKSGNILINIADHFSQFVSVDKMSFNQKNINLYKRNYKKFNEKSFIDDLSLQIWENNLDVNEKFTDFNCRLESCVNRHAPLKKVSIKEIKTDHKPWITDIIKRKIKQRNKLFARRKREPHNDTVNYAYKRFQNSVKRDIMKAKKNYYAENFESSKNYMKKL